MEDGRTTTLSFKYNKKKVSRQLKPYLEEFTYTDTASGGSDEIEVSLNNTDMRFLNKWKPLKGAKMTAMISMNNWQKVNVAKSFSCGKFILDDLSAEGPESTFVIKGVSAPIKEGFRATERTKKYKKGSVKSIAKKIAKKYKVSLWYEASNITIKQLEQSKKTDSAFLLDLCEEYGLGIKIYNDKIIIFDEEKYEKKKSIATIKRKNDIVVDWSWNTTMQKTYTGAKVTYTGPNDNKKHKAQVGKKGRMLNLNITAFSKKDAKLKAKAKLREENKKKTTMSLTVIPDARFIASGTLLLSGFGKASGKYYIDEAEHNVSGDGGYTMTLELHKVKNNETKTSSGTSSKTSSVAKSTLRKGSKGAEVKKLQKNLNALGHKDSSGKKLALDSSFGAKTQYALKRFQKKHKLQIDGVYGPKSYAAMKKAIGD